MTITSAAILGACALNAAAKMETFHPDEFNGDIISAIESNKNFAYQGGFDTFDGELPGEWIIKGPKSPEQKDIEKFRKRGLEVPEFVTKTLSGIKETNYIEVNSTENGNALSFKLFESENPVSLETNVLVSPGYIYGLYYDIKVTDKQVYTKTSPSGGTVDSEGKLSIKVSVSDTYDEKTRYRPLTSSKGLDLGVWYNKLHVLTSESELKSFNISLNGTKLDAEIRNLKIINLDDVTMPKKLKKNSSTSRKTIEGIMAYDQFVPSVWDAREVPRDNASEFYIHYLQGALQLTDVDTNTKIRQQKLSVEKLKSLTNEARNKKELPSVNF